MENGCFRQSNKKKVKQKMGSSILPLRFGYVTASDLERLGDIGVWDIDLDGQIRDVLDPVVVGVPDQGLHRDDGVHCGNEPAVAEAHRVHPLHNLVLDHSVAAAFNEEHCQKGVPRNGERERERVIT